MNLSFSKTIEPLMAGKKTVTRRIFKPRQIKMWQTAWDEDRRVHFALDKVPFLSGKMLGWIELTQRPYLEQLCDMPLEDLEEEGGMVESVEEFAKLINASTSAEALVIRFNFIPFDIERLFRPSNSDAGVWFEENWCGTCSKNNDDAEKFCPILLRAHGNHWKDPDYPREWLSYQGHVHCIGWMPKQRKRSEKKGAPVLDGQLDFFGEGRVKTK